MPTKGLIYDPENLDKYAVNLSQIYKNMAKYYEGVETANVKLLEEVFHKNWNMRDTDTQNESYLNVENKQKFIQRVAEHGAYLDYARNRTFAKIDLVYDNLAFVRINKDESRSSTSFFFFQLDGNWTITDKVWVNPREEYNDASESPNSYSEIEELLNRYYTALSTSNRQVLEALLHEKWDLKYLDADTLKSETRELFLNNLDKKKYMYDHSQLLTIDLYHDKLAIARIDQPTLSSTTFITVFKVNGEWTIASVRRSDQQR